MYNMPLCSYVLINIIVNSYVLINIRIAAESAQPLWVQFDIGASDWSLGIT